MPKYSQKSLDKLNTCHQDLITIFKYVILDYDCTIVCGHRGEAEQNEAFEQGNSQLRWPNSKHNKTPSEAVDAVPYEHGLDWNKLQSAYFAGRVMEVAILLYSNGLIKSKIRCGIDWDMDNDINDTQFWDACHFEILT